MCVTAESCEKHPSLLGSTSPLLQLSRSAAHSKLLGRHHRALLRLHRAAKQLAHSHVQYISLSTFLPLSLFIFIYIFFFNSKEKCSLKTKSIYLSPSQKEKKQSKCMDFVNLKQINTFFFKSITHIKHGSLNEICC